MNAYNKYIDIFLKYKYYLAVCFRVIAMYNSKCIEVLNIEGTIMLILSLLHHLQEDYNSAMVENHQILRIWLGNSSCL
jgi:hypothetical protein